MPSSSTGTAKVHKGGATSRREQLIKSLEMPMARGIHNTKKHNNNTNGTLDYGHNTNNKNNYIYGTRIKVNHHHS